MELRLREAVGMKIAIAVIRDVVRSVREECIDVARLLWLLNELDEYADRVVREWLGSKALEIGKYVSEDMLRVERSATASPLQR